MTFTLRPSTKLIHDQLIASYNRNRKIALLTVSTGGGKTYGAIHTFGSLFPNATLIVFTTAKITKSKQWENSVADYNEVMNTHLKIICYNYDKLASKSFNKQLMQKINLVKNTPMVLILDEIHRIKMASSGKLSKRAYHIINLARQPFITTTLGLSATAFSNSYLDVAPYLIIAGYYRNKTEFLNRHVKELDKYHQPVVTDKFGKISRDAFIDPDLIDRELKSITVFVDTSQYKPKLHSYHEFFRLNTNDRISYNQIMIDYKNKKYDFPIQARMDQERLLVTSLASRKDSYILSLLYNQISHKIFNGIIAPVLIFYQYTSACIHLKNLLKTAFPKRSLVIVNGKVKTNQKLLSKPPSNDAIYLVQYEAGGEGLDWQWSNVTIFYEAPVRYEKFVQAKGRNVRNKSEMSDIYQFGLEFVNTLDSERWAVNRNKRDFTDDVSKRTFLKNVKKLCTNK